MINKIVLSLLVLAGVIALVISLGNVFNATVTSSVEDQVKVIDHDIEVLAAQIKQIRIEMLNAQVEAQALLPVEWAAYTRKIEEVEALEKKAEALQIHLEELKEKKQNLIKQVSPYDIQHRTST